jgi:hypothetical protein
MAEIWLGKISAPTTLEKYLLETVPKKIDIEQLRDYRCRVLLGNWLKELRTEQYKLIYEEPIYPKNLYLNVPPPKERSKRDKIHRESIEKLCKRGTWVRPGKR